MNPKTSLAHYLLGEIARKAGGLNTAHREFATAESLSESESEHDLIRLTELSRETRK